MSGQITNPLSSDFNPTSSISFSSESIPIAAYGLIGLTSLTLAYVTLIASGQGGKSPSGPASSATSMLPSIFSPKTPASPSMIVSPFGSSTSAQAASSIPMAQAVPVTPTPEQGPLAKPAMGGKTRHNKKHHKHKKTKRSKR